MTKRAQIEVSGQVQGVSYRYHAQVRARGLGLTGWVRNLPDGRVQLVAEGSEGALAQLVSWCRRGPADAVVRDVQVQMTAAIGEFSSFEIRR